MCIIHLVQVNRGFVTLRTHIPVVTKSKKLSKVETLRQAAKYIKYLQEELGYTPTEDDQQRVLQFDLKRELHFRHFVCTGFKMSPTVIGRCGLSLQIDLFAADINDTTSIANSIDAGDDQSMSSSPEQTHASHTPCTPTNDRLDATNMYHTASNIEDLYKIESSALFPPPPLRRAPTTLHGDASGVVPHFAQTSPNYYLSNTSSESYYSNSSTLHHTQSYSPY
jgi:hypothetical protein